MIFVFLAITALTSPRLSPFRLPRHSRLSGRLIANESSKATHINQRSTSATTIHLTWSPQDLTADNDGFRPIPDDDYLKKYQEKPDLWPVEFFLVPYRRRRKATNCKDNDDDNNNSETQILVRRSANGTSKYGLGTGVPATRWMVSTGKLPRGYEWTDPPVVFEASDFPEFPKGTGKEEPTRSWAYRKIHLRDDAFHDSERDNDDVAEFKDAALEEYAKEIREHLKTELLKISREGNENSSSRWESERNSVVQTILESDNSIAAIQGTLRMSGLFEKRKSDTSARFVAFSDGPDPAGLARSVKIYTMFPQMPDPMPLPSAPPAELKEEIMSRPSRMAKSGRDPHKDDYGRTYTHISTSNVSNTIHGVYLSFDATNCLPADASGVDTTEEVPPALDLFGTTAVEREWKSLQELKVLDQGGNNICTEDPKSTFISGFIARQLVKEGAIDIHGSTNQ